MLLGLVLVGARDDGARAATAAPPTGQVERGSGASPDGPATGRADAPDTAVAGVLTARSSSSVQLGGTRTWTTASSTVVERDGTTASLDDLAVGDRVVVQPSVTDPDMAARIVVPSGRGTPFGGPGGQVVPHSPGSDQGSTGSGTAA